MRDHMLDHGLEKPRIGTNTGYFQVTFLGPGDNIERIKVPEESLTVTPAIEVRLNDRQRSMMKLLLQGEELTSRRCSELFSITRDTATRDFNLLIKLGLDKKEGRERSTRYILAEKA